MSDLVKKWKEHHDAFLPHGIEAESAINAANHMAECIEQLEAAVCCFVREEFENMNFENDQEAIDHVISYLPQEKPNDRNI